MINVGLNSNISYSAVAMVPSRQQCRKEITVPSRR